MAMELAALAEHALLFASDDFIRHFAIPLTYYFLLEATTSSIMPYFLPRKTHD